MTTLLACTLTGTLCLSAGWCWGHRTARIRHVRIPAGCHCRDQTAIDADEDAFIAAFRDRLDEGLGAYLDQTTDPDDPRNAA